MLKVVNDNKIGSHVIMVPPHSKYVSLEWPAHNKRIFPKDNPTVTPKFNSCKPKAYNRNMTPLKDNSYSNNYNRSTTMLEPHTKESCINNLIR